MVKAGKKLQALACNIMNIPNLFTPVSLGALEVPNRIVMAPLTRMRAGTDRVPTALMAE